jgi:DedD protein
VKEAAAKAAADKLALEAKLAKEHKAQELKDARDRAEAKAKAEHEQKLADAKAEKARAELEAKAKQEARAKLEQEQKLAKAKADAEAKAGEGKHSKPDDSARAMAILEDKPSDARYMVQVAAVASQEKVDELQNKLREAGIKSFTQKVNTAGGGSLTRIRVGPFTSKDEAEKVRAKLSKIGLSSSLATS